MLTFLATVGRTCVVLTALWTAAPTAHAQVTFSAPPECGSEQEFLTEVRALQRADAAAIRLTSVVIRERGAGAYELRLDGPEGGRLLTDADCRTLFRSAVVIAAAAAGDRATEPEAAAAPLPPPLSEANPAPNAPPSAVAPGESPPAPLPPQQPVPTAPAAAVPAPVETATEPTAEVSEPRVSSAATSHYLRVAAGGGGATGLSPDVAWLLELGVAFGSPTWGGAVLVKYLPPISSRTEGDLGLELETIGGRLGIFYAPVAFLRLEGGLAVYRLTARGTGISHPTTDSVWMAAPELETMFVARLSPAWALELGPQGRVGLTKPTFQVKPETEVFQVPRFGAALVFRVQWGWR